MIDPLQTECNPITGLHKPHNLPSTGNSPLPIATRGNRAGPLFIHQNNTMLTREGFTLALYMQTIIIIILTTPR